MAALEVTGLSKRYGGVDAVVDLSLSLAEGQRRALIGPNGAGKTTLFHCIAGTQIATSGTVTLFGSEITRLPPYARARAGLARTFQITNLFANLEVIENVLLAVAAFEKKGLVRPMRGYRPFYERAGRLLEQWGLAEKPQRLVRHLSYGEQRQLELALALAGSPRLLLLDEPTAGLSAAESARVVSMVRALPRDISLLMIEHDMDVAFDLADRITVMHQGRIIAEGDRQAIRANPQVAEIYLGVE
jgi:branched-chain amino acid transport system ATP-binding protein